MCLSEQNAILVLGLAIGFTRLSLDSADLEPLQYVFSFLTPDSLEQAEALLLPCVFGVTQKTLQLTQFTSYFIQEL